jgi:hypothetical protein
MYFRLYLLAASSGTSARWRGQQAPLILRHLYTNLYVGIYIPICTLAFIYQSVRWHLYTNLYVDIYIPICTLAFIYRSVRWHLYTDLYVGIYIPICTLTFIYQSVRWHLYTNLYVGIYIPIGTLSYPARRKIFFSSVTRFLNFAYSCFRRLHKRRYFLFGWPTVHLL